jgi:Rieske Fe-S protein
VTVPVAQVPVGSAVVVGAVVVSQPTRGAFKAFSAVCTHEGCLVSRIDQDTAQCPCHGSLFSTVDGGVLRGPAQAPLAGRTVTVSGDTVTVN